MVEQSLVINGVSYVLKDEKLASFNGMEFCIVRTRDAGVFAGYVKERKGGEITLVDSIRLWQWYGASLSQLSQEGTPDPEKCRFCMTEQIKYLTEAIEITPCTERARINLQAVKQWRI